MRRSNIELLRIVLMLFIVMHHFIVNVVFRDLFYGDSVNYETNVAALVNSFLYSAVNCFVLISGYFGIRFKWKGIFSIYLVLLFYGLIDLFSAYCFSGQSITRSSFLSTILCFSHSRLWFIQCYIALYFMSPLLNKGLERLIKREYLLVVILFSILNLYFGYYWRGEKFNLNGYTTAQFVYMYILGGYLRKYVSNTLINRTRWVNLCLYFLFSIIWGELTILSRKTYIAHWYPWSYNNIFLVLAAVSFFCFWLSFDFENKFVNYLASGCLSIYALHCSAYIGETVLYGKVGIVCEFLKQNYGLGATFLSIFIFAGVLVFAVLLVDCLRRVLMRPLWHIWDKLASASSNVNE